MRSATLLPLSIALTAACGRGGDLDPAAGCLAVDHPILYVELDPRALEDERLVSIELAITVGDRTLRQPVAFYRELWVLALNLGDLVLTPQPVEVGVWLFDEAKGVLAEGHATTQVRLDACARVRIEFAPPA